LNLKAKEECSKQNAEHPTPNIQHPTSNLKATAAHSALEAKSAMRALQIKGIL
jgi:hypothetical protein